MESKARDELLVFMSCHRSCAYFRVHNTRYHDLFEGNESFENLVSRMHLGL